MSSSQRPRENSVLFSLRELRRIEDDRVKKEQEAARAPRLRRERQAKEAAERAAREAEERRVRDEAERARLAAGRGRATRARGQPAIAGGRAPRPRRGRDAHQRGAHAPRDAAQEEALAGQGRASSSPAVLVLIGGGVGYKMYCEHQTELATERARRSARVEAAGQEEAGRARGALREHREGHRTTSSRRRSREADIEQIHAGPRMQMRLRRAGRQAQCARTPRQRPTMPRRRRDVPKVKKRDIQDDPHAGL